MTQPEDVTCNAPFKQKFRVGKEAVAELLEALVTKEAFKKHVSAKKRALTLKHYTGGKMGEEWVGPILCAAAKEAFRQSNVDSGFRACGLLPFSPRALACLFNKPSRIHEAKACRPSTSSLAGALSLIPLPTGQIPMAMGESTVPRRSSRATGGSPQWE